MKNVTLLNRWQGGNAILWGYGVSHMGMTIRIERAGVLGNLHIRSAETTYICCPTRWDNCFFEVTQVPDGYILRDTAAGVEIHAGVIEFAENCKPIYMGSETAE